MDRVGTEMLVMGVVAEGSELLQPLGVDLVRARTELERLMGHGKGGATSANDVPFTTASRKALEDTVDCARSLGSRAVDTSHVLLAVLQQEGGNGATLLMRLCNSKSPKALKS